MLKDTKKYLKETAKEIREYKNQRPLKYRGDKDLWDIEVKIQQLKYHYRHHHIVYCLLRGRTMEEIERPSQDNKPNNFYLEKIKKEILEKYDKQREALCNCA